MTLDLYVEYLTYHDIPCERESDSDPTHMRLWVEHSISPGRVPRVSLRARHKSSDEIDHLRVRALEREQDSEKVFKAHGEDESGAQSGRENGAQIKRASNRRPVEIKSHVAVLKSFPGGAFCAKIPEIFATRYWHGHEMYFCRLRAALVLAAIITMNWPNMS